MKKWLSLALALCLCAGAFALAQDAPQAAGGTAGAQVVAPATRPYFRGRADMGGTAGAQVVTADMVRLYRLQSIVSKHVLESSGYAEYAAGVTVPDEPTALAELLTAGAVAQLAAEGGYQPDAARVESLVRGELFDVPDTEGMEYLAEYAKGIIDGFGGTREALTQTAVALKTLTLCAEDYLYSLAQADKNKSVKTLLAEINERLRAVPLARDDGAPVELSQAWLESALFLLTHYE